MAVKECRQVSAIVVDADTLRFGGSAFVRERTCRASGEWESISQTQEVRLVSCSECGHEFGMDKRDTIPFDRTLLVELPNFCPTCGAKVVN